jgi:hypothetical protein
MWALLAIAILSSASAFVETAGNYLSPARQAFDADLYRLRFAPLARAIPEGGVAGYLSDLDPSLPAATAEYYLAEYFLAPAVIENSTRPALVIANLHRPPPAGYFEGLGFRIERDFGSGLYLLRKARP